MITLDPYRNFSLPPLGAQVKADVHRASPHRRAATREEKGRRQRGRTVRDIARLRGEGSVPNLVVRT